MNSRLCYRAAIAACLLAPLNTSPAHAATTVDDCLAERPGAVTATAVTPGDDLVCLTSADTRIASEGNDTYLWVGATTTGTDTLEGDTLADPGTDRVSLELWEGAWVDGDHADPAGNYLGNRVHVVVEAFTFTPFDDTLGDPDNCAGTLRSAGTAVDMGAGADLVQCVAAQVAAGEGDDTVHGVADGSTVQAGPGQDFVSGDLDADVVSLGGGDDTATVTGGQVDEVFGGPGTDVVSASSNDLLFSARLATASTAKLARPTATATRQRCRQQAAVRTVRLNNRASTVAVRYTVAKRLHGRTVRDTVRVPADSARAKVLRVRAQRTARVTVRAAGKRLLVTAVHGRRC